MVDKRIERIAKVLVEHSLEVKKGQYVELDGDIEAKPLLLEVYKLLIKKGAYPIIHVGFEGLAYTYYKHASEQQLKHFPHIMHYEVKNIDSSIHIVAPTDRYELASIDPKKIALRSKILKKIIEIRRNKPWVLFYYPTLSYAKDAHMKLKDWKNFVFNSALLDWNKEKRRMEKIKKILDKGNIIRIIAKGTNLEFSIKGRNSVVGYAKGRTKGHIGANLPDGEVFTSPRENTVRGYITFTYPAIIDGRKVSGIKAEFLDGKLIKISAKKGLDVLKAKLSVDKGASKLGELGIGCNKKIRKFVNCTLFDEKIEGTIHLAFGASFKECKGTNKSVTHLDLILDLRKEHGGGEVWVDDKLLIKDGKFKI